MSNPSVSSPFEASGVVSPSTSQSPASHFTPTDSSAKPLARAPSTRKFSETAAGTSAEVSTDESSVLQRVIKNVPLNVLDVFNRDHAKFAIARKAVSRIKKAPFDSDAWSTILESLPAFEYVVVSRKDQQRVYETCLTLFPTCGRFWNLYVSHWIKLKDYEQVEKIFQKCLVNVLHIDLWKTYLNYIRDTKSGLASFREKMVHAYEFAIEKVGLDMQSTPIWTDYIKFLDSLPGRDQLARTSKISAIRKIYQKAIVTPISSLETIWNDYSSFERTHMSGGIAQKLIDERTRDYINARRVAKDLESNSKGINRNRPAVPLTSSAEEKRQLRLWYKYINWEKTNPVRTDDVLLETRRVIFAYQQCLLCFAYCPHVWLEAAQYMLDASQRLTDRGLDQQAAKQLGDEGAQFLEKAMNGPLCDCPLIHFALADINEQRLKKDKVHEVYQHLLEQWHVDPTLAYIQYMRFARRVEGIRSARLVFKKAREDSRSTWQVYLAAALIEYHCTKDHEIAIKIFELGLKKYPKQIGLAQAYLDHLIFSNNDQATRALFERILNSTEAAATLDPTIANPIWKKLLSFEQTVGDQAFIHKVERKRLAVLVDKDPESSSGKEDDGILRIKLMVDRYSFADLLPASSVQLSSLGYEISSDSSGEIRKEGGVESSDKDTSKFCLPNFHQMIPFKPAQNALPQSHIVPGGVFPPPRAVGQLMQLLPPPHSFNGPFVMMDQLMGLLTNSPLPSLTELRSIYGSYPLNAPPEPGTQATVKFMTSGKLQLKTSFNSRNGNDNVQPIDEADNPPPPPGTNGSFNDLFRQRQAKRAKTDLQSI